MAGGRLWLVVSSSRRAEAGEGYEAAWLEVLLSVNLQTKVGWYVKAGTACSFQLALQFTTAKDKRGKKWTEQRGVFIYCVLPEVHLRSSKLAQQKHQHCLCLIFACKYILAHSPTFQKTPEFVALVVLLYGVLCVSGSWFGKH